MSSVALRTAVVARAGLQVVIGETRRHPRHLVLFAVVAGLLVAPRAPQLVVPLAGAAALLAGRVPLALAAVAAVLGAALLAQARARALGPGRLAASVGSPIAAEAVLLEPVRVRANGSVAVRARIVGAATGEPDGAALADRVRGELAVIRSLDGSIPPGAGVVPILRAGGRVAAPGPADQFQTRRGAHAPV